MSRRNGTLGRPSALLPIGISIAARLKTRLQTAISALRTPPPWWKSLWRSLRKTHDLRTSLWITRGLSRPCLGKMPIARARRTSPQTIRRVLRRFFSLPSAHFRVIHRRSRRASLRRGSIALSVSDTAPVRHSAVRRWCHLSCPAGRAIPCPFPRGRPGSAARSRP